LICASGLKGRNNAAQGNALGTGHRNNLKPRMGDIKSPIPTGSAPSGQRAISGGRYPGRCPGLDYFRPSGVDRSGSSAKWESPPKPTVEENNSFAWW